MKNFNNLKGLVALLAIMLLLSACGNTATSNNSNTIKSNTNNTTPATIAPEFSLTDVAQHNTAKDCWLAIQGSVYEITSFISRHPGGQAILQGCGKDATELFETRPMGSGTPHSDRARENLKNFFIGTLKTE
ncbi:MAG: cytochrome b5 domain-containing protein [Candidatus Komeilibacteria bacterium]